MSTMPHTRTDVTPTIYIGVDTHKHTHHVAAVDGLGRELGDAPFPANAAGYQALIAWTRSHDGLIGGIGIEGTGTYGAGLTRALHAQGVTVIDVDRPDRKARRAHGKTDPLDAYAAARAVASGRAQALAKVRDGDVEALRLLHMAIRQTVTARATAITELKSSLVITPEPLRADLDTLTDAALFRRCAALRPDSTTDPVLHAAKTVLRATARRIGDLNTHITALRRDRRTLVKALKPELLAQPGIGYDSAAQLLITFGENADRIHSEAAFAHLTGVAPIPASSGKTDRQRLNRGGDRQANRSLYVIAINRLRFDERTQAYAAKRAAESKSRRDIIRCLKRYIAREIYRLITTNTAPQPAEIAA
jgi:transposase